MKKFKLENMTKNSKNENNKRIKHEWKVGDLALIIVPTNERGSKLERPTEGPCKIAKVHPCGKVTILRGDYLERMKIRSLKPHNTTN